MAPRVRTRLPLNPMAAAKARRSLEPLRSHVDPMSFESLLLLVSELVNNSVTHSGCPEGDPIFLAVDLAERSVRAEVMDRGVGFASARVSPSPGEGTGWGLFLVDQLADQWGYSGEGPTRIWFEISTREEKQVGRGLPRLSHPRGRRSA